MRMAQTRTQIAQQTSQKLAAAKLGSIHATIGLDGFVDEIIAVVDKRTDYQHYEPGKTIAVMAKKIQDAVGQSSNYELIVKQRKLGGNGPIMSNALAAMGLSVTYIGNLGYPTIDPVFEGLASRAKVISIAEPGHTDALEFDDGKLMLGKIQCLDQVSWENLIQRVGGDQLEKLVDESTLIGMVNWTMLPHMSDIWTKLLDQVLTGLGGQRRKLFIDLADPEKRTHADISDALKILAKFQQHVDVILGLNLKESSEIIEVLGLPM